MPDDIGVIVSWVVADCCGIFEPSPLLAFPTGEEVFSGGALPDLLIGGVVGGGVVGSGVLGGGVLGGGVLGGGVLGGGFVDSLPPLVPFGIAFPPSFPLIMFFSGEGKSDTALFTTSPIPLRNPRRRRT